MIQLQNYPTLIEEIGFNNLNEGQQQAHELIKEGSSGFNDWKQLQELMDSTPEIKETVTLYLQQIEKMLPVEKGEKIKPQEKKKLEEIKQMKYTVYVWTNPDYKTGKNFATEEEAKEYIKTRRREDKTLKFKLEKFRKEKSVSPGAKKALKEERAKRKEKPAKPKKEKKVKAPKEKKVRPGVPIERVTDEVRFIRRYAHLDGKTKTDKEIMTFIDSLQKAISEKRIRKTSQYAGEIKHIQDELVAAYNKMVKNKIKQTTIKISPETVKKFTAIGKSEYAMPSIQLLKRYISWDGRKITKEKALKLSAQIRAAVQKGRIGKEDPYAQQLDAAWKNIAAYLDNYQRGTPLKIYEAELAGIVKTVYANDGEETLGWIVPFIAGGITEAIKAKVFDEWFANKYETYSSKIMATKLPWQKTPAASPVTGLSGTTEVISANDLRNKSYKTYGFTGKWLELFGDPTVPFSALIYGKPKGGKSTLALLLAQYLANNFGHVLYVSSEEDGSPTLQERMKRFNIASDKLHFSSKVVKVLPGNVPPDFIIIDTITKSHIGVPEIVEMRKQLPNASFLYVAQVTKAGDYRGHQEIEHAVDVVITVEDGIATSKGRFTQSGTMDIFNSINQ